MTQSTVDEETDCGTLQIPPGNQLIEPLVVGATDLGGSPGGQSRATVMRCLGKFNLLAYASTLLDTTSPLQWRASLCALSDDLAGSIAPLDSMFGSPAEFYLTGPEIIQTFSGLIYSQCRVAAEGPCAIAPNEVNGFEFDVTRAIRLEDGYGLYMVIESCGDNVELLQTTGLTRSLVRE